jgi:uncharacterized protein (TIGR03000 family)
MKRFMHVAALGCCLSLFLFAQPAFAGPHGGGGHGGGGHGGGGHMGGGHAGGAHVGGYGGGGYRGGYGGYRGGYGGYRGGYGYRGYGGYGLYGWGGLGYWPSYGYAPYYDTYASSPDFYYAPDYSAAPIANYDTNSPTIVTPQSYNVPAAPAIPPDTTGRAKLHVLLPDANARVFIEGTLTQQNGTNREFITPPLTPDKSYVYTIRATWMDNGRQMDRSMDVKVQAGRGTTVDFRAPPNPQP